MYVLLNDFTDFISIKDSLPTIHQRKISNTTKNEISNNAVFYSQIGAKKFFVV